MKETEAIFLNRPTFILAVDYENVILLKVGEYADLVNEQEAYKDICSKRGMRIEIVEILDKNEVELLRNNARQLQIKFEYLMQKGNGGEINSD